MGFNTCTVCQSSSVEFTCKTGITLAVLCEVCVLSYIKNTPGTHSLSNVNSDSPLPELSTDSGSELIVSRERDINRIKQASEDLFKIVSEFASLAIPQDKRTFESLNSLTSENQKKESELKNAKEYIKELQSEISTLNRVIEAKNSQIVAVSNELQAALSEKRLVEEYKDKIASYEEEVQKLRNHTIQITNSLVTVQTFKDKEIEDLKKSQSDFQTKENNLLSLITQKSSENTQLLAESKDKVSKLNESQSELSLLQKKVAKYEEENQRLAHSNSLLEKSFQNTVYRHEEKILELNQRLMEAEETKTQTPPPSQPVDKLQVLEQAPKVYKSKINFEGWDKDSKKRYREFIKGDLSLLKTVAIHLLNLSKKCPVCKTSHFINPKTLKYLACTCRAVIYCRNCAKKPKCTCEYGAVVKDLADNKLPFRVSE